MSEVNPNSFAAACLLSQPWGGVRVRVRVKVRVGLRVRHGRLLAAHHCLHAITIANGGMLSLAALTNHITILNSPAAFNLVVGEAVVTVFIVETTCRDGEVGVGYV